MVAASAAARTVRRGIVCLLLCFGCTNYSGCPDEVIPEKIAGYVPISAAGVYNPRPRRGPPPALVFRRCLLARWQSGYAADCKSVYAGSIPTRASKLPKNGSHISVGHDGFGTITPQLTSQYFGLRVEFGGRGLRATRRGASSSPQTGHP